MKQLIAVIALFVGLGVLADSTSSWTWNCESTDCIASGNAGSLACDGLTSTAKASDMSTTVEVASGHLKLTPATTDAGGHFATVTLPAEVSSYSSSQYDSWTLSFDYAPSKGKNDQNQTIYGLSVHDQAGKALVWFYGYRNTSFTVFKGPDQTSSLGTIDVGNITQYDESKVATNWFHVVISASRTDGVTMAMTNLTSGAEVALSSNVLSEQFAAPQSVLVRTACYSSRLQWALLDNFSFEGTTIYKKKLTKSADYTFEADADQSILTNGFVTSTLLGTTATINDSVNWTVVTGEASPKSGEGFAQISSTGSNTQGLLVNLPKSVTRATEYVLEFDAMMMSGYNSQNTNGIAIVGRNGVLATLFNNNKTTKAILYKGDSAENVLKDDVEVTNFSAGESNNNPPSTYECIWYHFIVRGDAENGVRLSMSNVATGASVVENVSLGAYDTVEKIALRASIHSSRYIYACIDNIEAYTYSKKGLMIIFR
jgi:hypothetical protein